MIGDILALIGALLIALSALGMVRFGDLFSRMHALAKGSMLGILLLFAGAAVDLGEVDTTATLVLAGILYLVTLPPASNLVSRAAYRARGSNDAAGIPRVATGRPDDQDHDRHDHGDRTD